MAKEISNTSTKIIIAATLTVSSATYGYDIDMSSEINFEPTTVTNKALPFKFQNNLSEDINKDFGTNTTYWNKDMLTIKREDSKENKFSITFDQKGVIALSKELFEDSEILDKELSLALIDTIEKVGKTEPKLNNRL